MDSKTAERDEAQLRTSMRSAIERGEFRVHYQPIVGFTDVDGNGATEVVGIEALLRWEHPRLGVLSPSRFLDVAEDTALILPIGAAAMRAACIQAAVWAHESGSITPLAVAVNLSARQLAAHDLLGIVTGALSVSGLDPRLLVLEVSEAALLDSGARSAPVLRELAALGVRLCIDDYGARHSSLRMVRDLPVSTLKIDRSFVAGLGRNPEDAELVGAVVAFAHAMGIGVIAQGVETPRQLSEVRSLGCDGGQGSYFARPQPGEIVQALVHHPLRWRERHSAA